MQYTIVYCDMAWHGMAWHGMAWHGMLCYAMLCYAMLCHDIMQPNATSAPRWAGPENTLGGFGGD